MPARRTTTVSALAVGMALVGLPLLGPLAAGARAVEPSPTAVASSSPKPTSKPTSKPSATPTRTATHSPSPTRSPTRTPSPSPTHTPTHTARRTSRPAVPAIPHPSSTATRVVQSTPPATVLKTSGPPVETVAPTLSPTPTPTEVAEQPAASSTSDGSRLAKLAALVVGAAVLLGLGGAAGLYVTRRRD